jgi:hypothetical protein
MPSMAVFCSSLTPWFPGMVLTYFQNDFETAPVAPIITRITLVFTFHIRCISIVLLLLVVVVVVVVVFVPTFMHGINHYTPETNRVSRIYITWQLFFAYNVCHM